MHSNLSIFPTIVKNERWQMFSIKTQLFASETAYVRKGHQKHVVDVLSWNEICVTIPLALCFR